MYNIGDRLPNGATVVDFTDTHVLAVREHMVHPYVTWGWNRKTGETFHGDYLLTLEEAVGNFKDRAGLNRPQQ